MSDTKALLDETYGAAINYGAERTAGRIANARATAENAYDALDAHLSALLAERDGLNTQVVQYAELHAKMLEVLGVEADVFTHGRDPIEAANSIRVHSRTLSDLLLAAEAERDRARASYDTSTSAYRLVSAQLSSAESHIGNLTAERDALRAENERLKTREAIAKQMCNVIYNAGAMPTLWDRAKVELPKLQVAFDAALNP